MRSYYAKGELMTDDLMYIAHSKLRAIRAIIQQLEVSQVWSNRTFEQKKRVQKISVLESSEILGGSRTYVRNVAVGSDFSNI